MLETKIVVHEFTFVLGGMKGFFEKDKNRQTYYLDK